MATQICLEATIDDIIASLCFYNHDPQFARASTTQDTHCCIFIAARHCTLRASQCGYLARSSTCAYCFGFTNADNSIPAVAPLGSIGAKYCIACWEFLHSGYRVPIFCASCGCLRLVQPQYSSGLFVEPCRYPPDAVIPYRPKQRAAGANCIQKLRRTPIVEIID